MVIMPVMPWLHKLVVSASPGANINYQTGHAIFEATHGTAPDIADQDKANPCSVYYLAACF